MKKAIVAIIILGLFSGSAYAQVTKQNWDKILKLSSNNTGNIATLGTSSSQLTLPRQGDSYLVCSFGNTAYIRCSANPTATTSVGGFDFAVTSGSCLPIPIRIDSAKCAHIATTATGFVQFIHLDSALP